MLNQTDELNQMKTKPANQSIWCHTGSAFPATSPNSFPSVRWWDSAMKQLEFGGTTALGGNISSVHQTTT